MTDTKNIPDSIREKMVQAGISAPAIRSFEANYLKLAQGETGMMSESTLSPVDSIPSFNDLEEPNLIPTELGAKLVVVKLNGGLGTGMGLDKAKSLLEVKDGLTFLDLISRQILFLRKAVNPQLQFLLMNSFSTRKDSLHYLEQYPELPNGRPMDFLQSKVPKISVDTMEPLDWPADPGLEWCPPGHGDIYLSLFATGLLDQLIRDGIQYAFISNSDNLGAYPDFKILQYMDQESIPFLMEVTRRTEADRKGGHLARRKSDKRLVLREGAQCPSADQDAFQDIEKHGFFNTNNLWIRLDHLRALMSENGGYLPLPLIRNEKTVDPTKSDSPAVYQLETAMGAAIEMFEGAQALEVPRTRFAPVKKTDDLLALRSDAYEITEDFRVQLIQERHGIPPTIKLDSEYFKMINGFDRHISSIPSLKDCKRLTVKGSVLFEKPVSVKGDVTVTNSKSDSRPLPEGSYCDQEVDV
ncbi:MAG: UTP--glucose-1-phosphate uridylyltransferase [Verrucomicrobiota bacterium]